MALPVLPVTLPPDLVNAANGRLPDASLVDVGFPGRTGGRLHLQMARAWWAMVDACMKATGVTLTCTSIHDAYRTYQIQLSAWLTRMEPVSYATYLVTSSKRRGKFIYGGHKYWRLRPGMAKPATPGTSNHGWGLAVDVCELLGNGSVRGISSSPAWAWLKQNLRRFGISWEWVEEGVEDWHIRLWVGEAATEAVLQFEANDPTSPLPVFDPVTGRFALWPLAANKPRIGPMSQGDAVLYLQGVIFHKAGGNIPMHGYYDQQTIDRVMDLQRWFKLTVDGWVGPQTWKLIDALAVQ